MRIYLSNSNGIWIFERPFLVFTAVWVSPTFVDSDSFLVSIGVWFSSGCLSTFVIDERAIYSDYFMKTELYQLNRSHYNNNPKRSMPIGTNIRLHGVIPGG